MEIYNEEIRDLLSKNAHNKLDLKETPDSGVFVKDLTSYVVKSTRECDKLRDFGAKNRHTGATAMNQDSSRSHSIYTITVESCEQRPDGSSSIRMGKLNLVDLAGSERQSKTQATGCVALSTTPDTRQRPATSPSFAPAAAHPLLLAPAFGGAAIGSRRRPRSTCRSRRSAT